MPRFRVVFVCLRNTCLSQMAEGIANQLHGSRMEAISGGLEPGGAVDERAIRVMQEIGVDISEQQPHSIDEITFVDTHFLVSIGEAADETFPFMSEDAIRYNWDMSDPADLAGEGEQVLEVFRTARDELKHRIARLAAAMPG